MEVWKEIDGFENYLVSNKGSVFSKNANKIIANFYDTKGYVRVSLYKNSKRHDKRVHRLVASAFIDNPNNLPQVNHKDEVKENNCVENLEWCDNYYNNHYGTCHKRTAIKNTNCKSTSVPVRCVETGEVFPSIREAQRKYGAKNIDKCICGERKTCSGFHWEYASNIRRLNNKKVVLV